MSPPVNAAITRFVPRAGQLAARLAAGFLVGAPLACPGGYLARVGPAPLRHAEELPRLVRVTKPVETAAPAKAAPPQHPDTAGADPAVTNDAPEAIVLTAKSPLPWFDWLTPVTPPPRRAEAAPSEDVASPHSEITPQSMIPFFQTRTGDKGGREVSTWGAVTFTPPVPGQRPESKAGYQQTPAPAPAPAPPTPRP